MSTDGAAYLLGARSRSMQVRTAGLQLQGQSLPIFRKHADLKIVKIAGVML